MRRNPSLFVLGGDAALRPVRILALAVAVLATACTSSAPRGTATSAGALHGSPTVGAGADLPNPFTITRRFPAARFGLHHPLGLAVGPDGNLYITDTTQTVTVVSPDGKVLAHWGTKGSGLGEFDFVPDLNGNLRAPIAVGANGDVYVSDQGNGRIDVHRADGTLPRQFGRRGFQSEDFINNQTLAVDAAGNVYVADDAAESLLMFSPADKFVWNLQGGDSASDPNLRGHFVVEDVDSHGRVVAGVDNAHRIVYIDAKHHDVESFSTAGMFRNDWGPCDVTVDGQGDTLVQSCPDAGHPIQGVPSYQAALLFDRHHQPVGAWYHTPWSDFVAPRPGADGNWFALADDGTILELRVALPGA